MAGPVSPSSVRCGGWPVQNREGTGSIARGTSGNCAIGMATACHAAGMSFSTEFVLTAGRRRRRWHLFNNARLNWVGWTALLGASLVSAALGALVASTVGAPPWLGAAVGLPLVLLVLVATDRRRTWRGSCQFGWTESLAEVAAAAETLRQQGVEVTVHEGDYPSLTFRRRDRRAVAAALGFTPGHSPWQ